MSTEATAAPLPAKREHARKEKEVEAAAPKEPIIIDLGKKNRKQVRKLRKGKPGRLMNRVEETLEHLRENGAVEGNAQAVVIVVKERPKNRGGRATKMWGLG
jgi:hypothetical protein